MVPARKVRAVDTTAAGDTFCGAVCTGLTEGMDLVEAVRFATAASSLTVQKPGAQDSLPYRNEVDKII
jgi:ribokinase